ncbi:ADP-ribose pyrophosphatase [Alkalibacterium sp. AK22]|uniref:NUDIX hydrolase n=1 Tax=Alkalibacterium sp. AK22 TaxID=1229520 RepID=UPI0004492DD7|nr:NUDIX hydrolase [Alkalibacterium sp. AK22]EXJ22843.1 ADP-ribose pyrophosphatase [Alkalibacterium sp. AK22]
MNFKEETISETSIYKGNVTEYTVQEVRLQNGKTSQREIVRHAGASAVIPFVGEDQMLLVRQYRKAIESESIEIPAGLRDAGESASETALRELEEETGYTTDQLSFVTSFYSTPGFTDEFLEIFEASNLYLVKDKRPMDEDEQVEVLTVSYDEAWNFYEKGLLRDSKTVFALFYWKMKKLMQKDQG